MMSQREININMPIEPRVTCWLNIFFARVTNQNDAVFIWFFSQEADKPLGLQICFNKTAGKLWANWIARVK